MSGKRRLRLRFVAGVAVLVALAAIGWPALTSVAERHLRQRIDLLAARAGVTVTVEDVGFGWSPLATLSQVRVHHGGREVASMERVEAHLGLLALVRGARRPERVDVVNPLVTVHVRGRRVPAFEKVRAAWRAGRPQGAGARPASRRRALPAVRVRGGRLDLNIAGEGERWLGRQLSLRDLVVDFGGTSGRVEATLAGAVQGRAHVWIDLAGQGSARLEAPSGLSARLPKDAPQGLRQVRVRAAAWRKGVASVTGLKVTSDLGVVTVERVQTDLALSRVAVEKATLHLQPSRVPKLARAARDLGLTGDVKVSVGALQLDDLRGAFAGGSGRVATRDVDVRVPAWGASLRLQRAELKRAGLFSPGPRRLELRVDAPQLRVQSLPKAGLLHKVRTQVARVGRLVLRGRRRARARSRITQGWARPVDPNAPDPKEARKKARAERRARRGKPAYTARYADAIGALPKQLDAAWTRLHTGFVRAAGMPLLVRVTRGQVAVQHDTLVLGARGLTLDWTGGRKAPARLALTFTPVIQTLTAAQATTPPPLAQGGGGVAVRADGDTSGLHRLAFDMGGAGLARTLAGIDARLAVGAKPDVSLGFVVEAKPARGGWISGRFAVQGLGVDWDRFAPGPVTDLRLAGPFRVRWPASAGALQWSTGALRFGGTTPAASDASASGHGVVATHGTMTRRLKRRRRRKPLVEPLLELSFALPRQDCGALVRSLPPALLPTVGGVRARGRISGWLDLILDVRHPYVSEMAFGLDDKRCKGVRLLKADVAALNEPFARKVNEDGKLIDVFIGPESDAWVDFKSMPRWVPYAMITTEDGGFYRHRGLNDFLLNRAIRLDLHYGRFVYGGSTITQQLAKNLFFTRSKFLARKLEELLVVWAMERTLSKVRIIEIYTNAVEFAPHVYGVARGAMHYFGKAVRDLTPLEAAWLGSIKPCPRCGDSAFRHVQYRRWYQKRLLEILTRMRRNEIITEAQFQAEVNTVPRFLDWPEDKLAKRFSHPIPEKKPPPARRLDPHRRR